MRYLCLQYHTDPVPGLQKPLVEGALRYLECRLSLVADVIRRNEHVCAMFEHLGREALGETIFRFVEVAKHRVAPPPLHQADCVWVHPRHEESHALPLQVGSAQ